MAETGRGPASRRSATVSAAIRERDRQLEEERGRCRELERRSRAREEAIAHLAHDLRGPLSAVMGWTSLLRSEQLDAVARERALATVERCARAQSELITSLLDVSRLTAGRMVLDAAPVDLGELVRTTVEEAQPSAREHGVGLEAVTADAPVVVMGDRPRLAQVLVNLVSNALKFTPAGGCVRVVAESRGDTARIQVSDTGAGIGARLLPHVFEAFWQGAEWTRGRRTRTRSVGLGLGLYIVREIIVLHHGWVEAASDGECKGATFTVTLPSLVAEGTHLPAAGSSGKLPVLADQLDGTRVLLVEDEADTRDVLTLALQSYGVQVVAAEHGDAALAALASFDPHVVVSDIALPDVDGCELLRRIRATRNVPAVAMSGYVTSDDEARMRAAGFDAHLGKPFGVRQLVSALLDVLASVSSSAGEAPASVVG